MLKKEMVIAGIKAASIFIPDPGCGENNYSFIKYTWPGILRQAFSRASRGDTMRVGPPKA
jgi:hypothetical protein